MNNFSEWSKAAICLKKEFIILKSGTEEKREREGRSHLMAHSPDNLKNQALAELKPGARSFLQVSHMDAGSKHLDHPYLLLQAISRKLDQKQTVRN